ncbi:MAG: DUF402 domain-containing protein [Chloroflexi bacterium]|nr:DUF402 domain-containing protein [Chloroflexota bacterium]
MKRKFSDRASWPRVLARRFTVEYVDTAEFCGYVSLLCLDQVREPLWARKSSQPVCIADTGYAWLQHFPAHQHHTVTTMFDAQGAIVQWYIDICKQQGLTEAGVPWFDDLYLDIIVLPSGTIEIFDADELDQALEANIITQADHHAAWAEVNRLVALLPHNFPLLHLSTSHYRQLLKQVITLL